MAQWVKLLTLSHEECLIQLPIASQFPRALDPVHVSIHT